MIEIEPYPGKFNIKKGGSVFFVDRESLSICGMKPQDNSVLTDLSSIKASSVIKMGGLQLRVKHPFGFLSGKIGSLLSIYDLFGVELIAEMDGILEGRSAEIDNSKISTAIVTLSDKGSIGQRDDLTGHTVQKIIKKISDFSDLYIIPDDRNLLDYLIRELADKRRYDLIITNGGTGVSPRDITADVTETLIKKRLGGFEQAMMTASIKETYKAVISRSVVGIRGKSLIINLPGSPRAAATNLNSVVDAIIHLIKKLNGDPTECGS